MNSYMNTLASTYDGEYVKITLAYDEVSDGYICPYCLNDMSAGMSVLHNTYGGDILPKRIRIARKTLKRLRSIRCVMCDLPACRAYDH